MQDQEAIRPLLPEEIMQMNLDKDGFYFLAFLMNDKQNRAMEPRPFMVPTKHLDSIADTAIGMPFIVGPDPSHHVYAASGRPDDIVRLSRKYTWGEIVSKIKNSATNNVYAVVKAFKEYVPKIKRGELPKYTSPMIAPDDIDEALATGIINGGRVLHLQAVASPGYDPKIAQIKGHVCSGMLGKCMSELRSLAAAGQLREWQNKINVVDYAKEFSAMHDSGDLPDPPTVQGLANRRNLMISDMEFNDEYADAFESAY